MSARPTNIAASIRHRLLNLSKERGEPFNLILDRFAAERLLYRLSVSPYIDRFVLKGALLFLLWSESLYRPTRDVDLLGFGESTIEELAKVFREVCRIAGPDDGLVFDADSVEGVTIREDQTYEGVRITLLAFLGTARISMQIDIGFGDAITPKAEVVEFPATLATAGLPGAKLRAYPRETVIAEKLEAMVRLGLANSRMKDFHDVSVLARNFSFDGMALAEAIANTFTRRETAVPKDTPVALTAEFARDRTKIAQWAAFQKRAKAPPADLLARFTLPIFATICKCAEFRQQWPAGGTWS
ncbi:MAG TPA: nucleotidyl transferase AbiEii/AbiGii toxin family protein [Chthoniobacteraceae bacterium]